ncbi:MAG TPA: M15 family metallopeptidase [Pyrinomonadaceae bacterium]|nr:M15 family metallopeptidase [Pyrinomonadaceae bacterium]
MDEIQESARRPGSARRLAALAALLCALAFAAAPGLGQRQHPPREEGNFRAPDLVEIIKLDPTVRLDIRYATPDNFTGRAVYTEARAFLQRPAALALVRAHRALKKRGYGLAVFDAYRPWHVTKLFWDITPEEKRLFVADPSKGSRHNRGCAVDLTLYELKTGRQVSMPSAFDDFTERAHVNYAGGTEEQRRLRAVLRAAMEAEGFLVFEPEWWHFDYKDWREYPILDISFSEIEQTRG